MNTDKLTKLSEILEILGYGDVNPHLVSVLQSVLFIQTDPVPLYVLKNKLIPEYSSDEIESAISAVFAFHEITGIRLNRMGGGYLYTTAPENAADIKRILSPAKAKLSKPALETLAIIAYRQPVTQNEINDIRGVNSESSIKLLMERNLIRTIGRKNEAGRPFLYSTTREFLTFMGINALSELPDLEEFQDKNSELFEIENTQESEKFIKIIEEKLEQPDFSEEFKEVSERFNEITEMQKRMFTALGVNYDSVLEKSEETSEKKEGNSPEETE